MFYSDSISMEGFWAHVENNIKWILMQFTGLHDRNGRAVYEGDIVKYQFIPESLGVDNPYYTCVVKWHDGSGFMWSAGWVFDRRNGKYEPFCCDDTFCLDNVEVIGNIHENPNLLQEQDNT